MKALSALAWTLVASVALAQPAATSGPRTGQQAGDAILDKATREAVVGATAKAMREGYVDISLGDRAAERIERALAAGEYDGLGRRAFARRLTVDLNDVVHDPHLVIEGLGSAPADAESPLPPISESGVVRADRLAGGVGYIEIVSIPPPDQFKPTLDRAMAALASSRALIIDLRRNGGGRPGGSAYLASFFAGSTLPTLLWEDQRRIFGTSSFRTERFLTSPTPISLAGKPVYILTSPRTFSSAEFFCYAMRSKKLAVLVGETTRGGGNGAVTLPLADDFTMGLPDGTIRAPSGGAWEGTGIMPDVAVPSDQALKVALQKLGESPANPNIALLSQASLFDRRDIALTGSEAALRRLINGQQRGQPPYDEMTPAFADSSRQFGDRRARLLTALGPLQSVTFRGPGWGNGDSYLVRFTNGAQLWFINLAADGKIEDATVRPAPSSAVQ